ncbi:YrdB family protein [Streptomyces sp. NPDC048623]|uniref:YrdB family protein n=1 Tax=Streptomyces sp. NPDC048623 TaxID=3155761 RepID=UPI00342E0AD8
MAAVDALHAVGALDVLAFGAELAVYAAAGWWAWTRPARRAVRLGGAVVAVAGLALLWGRFAAPAAGHPLHGAARAAFEICWFGAGALAAFRAYVARPRRTAQ